MTAVCDKSNFINSAVLVLQQYCNRDEPFSTDNELILNPWPFVWSWHRKMKYVSYLGWDCQWWLSLLSTRRLRRWNCFRENSRKYNCCTRSAFKTGFFYRLEISFVISFMKWNVSKIICHGMSVLKYRELKYILISKKTYV